MWVLVGQVIGGYGLFFVGRGVFLLFLLFIFYIVFIFFGGFFFFQGFFQGYGVLLQFSFGYGFLFLLLDQFVFLGVFFLLVIFGVVFLVFLLFLFQVVLDMSKFLIVQLDFFYGQYVGYGQDLSGFGQGFQILVRSFFFL